MRKIYSLVLMTVMLFVGANAWAVTHQVATTQQLETAWANAQSGDIIQLTTNVDMTKSLWLGTLEMNGTPRSLTLDLNGHKLINDGTREKLFFISHGELNVITSVAGGEIQHGTISEDSYSSSYVMFLVAGSTYKTLNPKTATSGYYTHLTIGSGVTLTAKSIAVAIDALGVMAWPISASTTIGASGVTIPSSMPADLNTQIYPTKGRGVANGVRIDVHGYIRASKYAFKSNGLLGAPSDKRDGDNGKLTNFVVDPANPGLDYTIANTDTAYTPFIRLYSTADMWVQADNNSAANDPKKPVAVYCSGYSRWLIEGTCVGSTGVYVKSGDVDIHDATIQSTYTGTYTPPTGTGSGTQGQGSAIVIESNEAYAGEIDVNIGGDTKVTATNGYAIDEKVTVTTNDTTKVNSIVITGGSFEGGKVGGTEENPQYGTISISEQTNQSHQGTDDNKNDTTIIKVGGGSVEGNVTVGNEGNLSSITDDNTYITQVTDPVSGNTTVVISEGSAPVVVANTFEIDDFTSGDVNLSDAALANKNQVFDSESVSKQTIGTLMMNNADDTVKLTIATGHTIEAAKVIMGYKAQIIVEPGATFIVTGDQGITAPATSNIILKASESSQATFLFNPAVSSNRNPNATVQYTSKAWRESATAKEYQFFCPPMKDGHVDTIFAVASDHNTTYKTQIDVWRGSWDRIGIMNSGTPLDMSKFNVPFGFYSLLSNNPRTVKMTYTMTGSLVGNQSPDLTLENGWTTVANGYTGTVDVMALWTYMLNRREAGSQIQPSIYTYRRSGSHLVWDANNELQISDVRVNSMDAIMFMNYGANEALTLPYDALVWTPAQSVSGAPVRGTNFQNLERVAMRISNANGVYDRLTIAQADDFSAERDAYDAAKYINDELNLYVTADDKYAIFATDNLANTYMGFSCVEGGLYTLSFDNVENGNWTLRDMVTGATIAIVEGASYQFYATDNEANDYRFKIVGRQEMPTDVETVENNTIKTEGIYTITGQYLGEMNVWNTLPAGLYIVNGEKKIK